METGNYWKGIRLGGRKSRPTYFTSSQINSKIISPPLKNTLGVFIDDRDLLRE